MIPTNPYGHVNEELSAVAIEAGVKRRRRYLVSILIVTTGFVVGIIVLLSLTAGNLHSPKFRVRSATFGSFNVGNSTSPSFDIAMSTEVGIRNRNFRRFHYRDTTVDLFYRDRKVGEGFVWDDRVKVRDTRKFVVPVILSSSNVTSSSELQNDLNAGFAAEEPVKVDRKV